MTGWLVFVLKRGKLFGVTVAEQSVIWNQYGQDDLVRKGEDSWNQLYLF